MSKAIWKRLKNIVNSQSKGATILSLRICSTLNSWTMKISKNENEIIVEQPDDMTDDEFGVILDNVIDSWDTFEDVVHKLDRRAGIEVISHSNNFPENPESTEIEIFDISDVKGESHD